MISFCDRRFDFPQMFSTKKLNEGNLPPQLAAEINFAEFVGWMPITPSVHLKNRIKVG